MHQTTDSTSAKPESHLAFVFPGQGSQTVGMLAELAGIYPEVKQTFDEASSVVGHDLWAISQQGPEAELNRTEITQPALLAAGVAVWRVWRTQNGAMPVQLAGHSLGEYTALVCAQALTLTDAVALVAERGRLMQAAVPQGVGAMAAVLGADDAVVEQVCAEMADKEVVAPANYNSPGQIVIAGHATAVDRVIARLAELGVRKAIKLPVSVPSHCALMKAAAVQLSERIENLRWETPKIPVIQNVKAQSYSVIVDIKQALVQQLFSPVRWTDCVKALAINGVGRLAECGPGKVLSGLIKRIDKTLDARSLASPDDLRQTLLDWR